MNHGSLFSGIGGFDLAAEWMGWNNIFQVEWDEYCQKLLNQNFPYTDKYNDINKFDGRKYKGSIDIITGGFPCQPFSTNGLRKGESDNRFLWPQMFRIIQEAKPSYVIGENVTGIISMESGTTFENICTDLESERYTVEPFNISASSVGAWHQRERIWIVAYRSNEWIKTMCKQENGSIASKFTSDNTGERLERATRPKLQRQSTGFAGDNKKDKSNWATEPGVGRVVHGIPHRVDRIKGIGNAIVPQVAYEIFKVIKQHHDHTITHPNKGTKHYI